VSFFWGEHNARLVPLNEQSISAVAEVLEAAGACSDMMDLVPRPHTSLTKPAFSYALKQIKRIAKDLTFGSNGTYIVCKNTVALTYRTRISEIVNGLY
jgi:hypothetical protein